MTPAKEKAKQLVEWYLNVDYGLIQEYLPIPLEFAKACALRVIDEIFYALPDVQELWDYWEEVKHEIENYDIQ